MTIKSFYAPIDKCTNCWVEDIKIHDPDVICRHAVCNKCYNFLSENLKFGRFNQRDLEMIFNLTRHLSIYETTPEILTSMIDEIERLREKINWSIIYDIQTQKEV